MVEWPFLLGPEEGTLPFGRELRIKLLSKEATLFTPIKSSFLFGGEGTDGFSSKGKAFSSSRILPAWRRGAEETKRRQVASRRTRSIDTTKVEIFERWVCVFAEMKSNGFWCFDEMGGWAESFSSWWNAGMGKWEEMNWCGGIYGGGEKQRGVMFKQATVDELEWRKRSM